jgi:hypothetical protein
MKGKDSLSPCDIFCIHIFQVIARALSHDGPVGNSGHFTDYFFRTVISALKAVAKTARPRRLFILHSTGQVPMPRLTKFIVEYSIESPTIAINARPFSGTFQAPNVTSLQFSETPPRHYASHPSMLSLIWST